MRAYENDENLMCVYFGIFTKYTILLVPNVGTGRINVGYYVLWLLVQNIIFFVFKNCEVILIIVKIIFTISLMHE